MYAGARSLLCAQPYKGHPGSKKKTAKKNIVLFAYQINVYICTNNQQGRHPKF